MRRPPTLSFLGAASAAAGVALFVWLIWQAGPREILAGVRQIGWGLLVIVLIAGLRFAVRASAWIRCLEPPHTLRLRHAFTAVVSGDALGNATPLGPLVGEPAKVAFVRHLVPLGAAFTALAIENLFYTLSVAAMVAAGTIALLVRGGLAGDVRLVAEGAIVLIIGAYVAAAWTLLRKPALLSSAVALVGRAWQSRAVHERLDKIRRLEQDIYSFTSRRRRAIAPLVGTELLFHTLGVLEVHVTLWLLLGTPPPLVTSFIFETVNRLIVVVFKFVPMQLGVNEGGTVLAAQILGVSPQAALTLAIVRRARILFWQMAGTGLLVRHGITAHRVLEDPDLTRDRQTVKS